MSLLFYLKVFYIVTSFLFHLGLFATEGRYAPPIILENQVGKPIGLYLDILEDKNKQWTIDDVASPELSKQFITSTTNLV